MSSHLTPLPPGLSLRDPAVMIATWFGTGLLPKAPGTWASLVALPLAWPLHQSIGRWGLLTAAGLLFLVGIWAAQSYVRQSGAEDPGPVVIDEIVGQWLTLCAAAQPGAVIYAVGFVLFRAADTVKPWPISWADRRLKGGFGAMFDDALAGALAGAVLFALVNFRPDIFR